MKKLGIFLKKHKKLSIVGLLFIIAGIYFLLARGDRKSDFFTIERREVSESVVLSGKVETSDRADLGFASSGRIANIFVKNSESVKKGRILAQLEIGDLFADLKIKELNLKKSDVDLEDAKEELEKIKKQEDTKVESAYRDLLTEGLELIPDSNTYGVASPSLGGNYLGLEGRYKINIDKENITLSDFRLLTFGLERTKVIIKEEGSTALGTKGLYISFKGDPDLSSYNDTSWFLDIPNKASSYYSSNLNAYNEAKNTRDLAIGNADAEYKKLLAENGGGDSIALSEIEKIKAEIRKNTIVAPFDGRVTNIEKEIGESANIGESVISVLGENNLEVVFQVSELDVSRLVPDASIKIFFDAIPGEEFFGILKTVNSKETEIDGVPVYEAFVELASDFRIKNGMSAKGEIILEKKEGVLAVPSYFIKKVGDSKFVSVFTESGRAEDREITTGITGSDSLVEIVSGLNEGEKIVGDANEK